MAQGRPGNPSWVKGVSGDPGGRPRAAHDVQALARQHTAAALNALVEALGDPKHKVSAATAILDRAWGRPPQTVAVDPASPPTTVLHLIAAKAASRELLEHQAVQTEPGAAAAELQQRFDLLSAPLPQE